MTICHTNITYAGVEIKNVLTDSINCTPVYDSTNTDLIGNAFAVEFTGEIHTAAEWEHGIQTPWETPPPSEIIQTGGGVFANIRQFLQPRQRFTMTNGDATWFDVYPSAVEDCNPTIHVEHGDIMNGPRASCQILSVKGARSVKCRFRVEFVIPPNCPTQDYSPFGILNVRWWVADQIDGKTWLTTRRYVGVVRVRHAQQFTSADVQYLRGLFLPPIQRGFRRDEISLSQSPNGLEWNFSVTDIEQWAQPPSPATDWAGTYTLSFPQMAITCEQEIRLRLRGERTVKKQALFALAHFIIDQRLQWDKLRTIAGTVNKDLQVFMLSQVWEEDIVQNEVSVSARMKVFNVADWIKGLPSGDSPFTLGQFLDEQKIKTGGITNTMWTDAGVIHPYAGSSAPPGEYDHEVYKQPPGVPTADGTKLFLAELQNPCCVNIISTLSSKTPSVYEAYPTSPGTTSGTSNITNETSPVSLKPLWSVENHDKAMYIHYAMGSKMHVDTGWRGFPLGKQCSTSSSQATMAFAHLHCPCSIREIKIHASRVNAWPQLPRPVHFEDPVTHVKHILRHYTIEPYGVQLSADGRDMLHEVTATYYYYLDRPYDILNTYENIPVGILPYVTDTDLRFGVIVDGIDRNGSQIAPSHFVNPSPMLTGKNTT